MAESIILIEDQTTGDITLGDSQPVVVTESSETLEINQVESQAIQVVLENGDPIQVSITGDVGTVARLAASVVDAEINASQSALDAAQSESNALTSATAAATSEGNASASATAAATSGDSALASATQANLHRIDASQSATDAANYSLSAATSEQVAIDSATTSQTYSLNAADSATAASASELKASQWAIHPVDTLVPGELEYSSKHYSIKAAASESAASASATSASASASSASASATSASASAATATTKAGEAQTAQTAAETARTGAETAETNAAGSASAASTSEGNAAASELKSYQWANHPEDTLVPGEVEYSAAHHAAKAAESAATATGQVEFLGSWDAALNGTPPTPANSARYIIITDGSILVDGVNSENVYVNDWITYSVPDAQWFITPGSGNVSSVNGYIGGVVLDYGDFAGATAITLANAVAVQSKSSVGTVRPILKITVGDNVEIGNINHTASVLSSAAPRWWDGATSRDLLHTGGDQTIQNGVKISGVDPDLVLSHTGSPLNTDYRWVVDLNGHMLLQRLNDAGTVNRNIFTLEDDAQALVADATGLKIGSNYALHTGSGQTIADLTVTGALTATASNASQLNGQGPSYYLDASNINAGTLGAAYLPDLSDTYLPLADQADDSAKLGGTVAANFIFGTTAQGTTSITDAVDGWNTASKSGFYDADGKPNAPTPTGWYWGVNASYSSPNYGWQMVGSNATEPAWYLRGQSNSVWGSWHRVLHEDISPTLTGNWTFQGATALTGAASSGHIVLDNEIGIRGKEVGGTERYLARVDASNKTAFGATSVPMHLDSSVVPQWYNGTTTVDVVHTGGGQTITGALTINGQTKVGELTSRDNQGIWITAGESANYVNSTSTGNGEWLYLGAENGVKIYSSPDNWVGGFAARHEASLVDSSGNSAFPGNVMVAGNVTGANLNVTNWDTAYGWGNHASAGYLLLTSGMVSGNLEFYSTDVSGNYATSAIELREVNLVSSTQSAPAYAPALAFHWGGRVQGQIALEADGKFHLRDGATHSAHRGLRVGPVTIEDGTVLSNYGSSAMLNIQSTYGYLRAGPANSSYCHFNTDRPNYYFDKGVRIAGDFYEGAGYNQKTFRHASSLYASGNVTFSTGAATGGANGDIWFQYA